MSVRYARRLFILALMLPWSGAFPAAGQEPTLALVTSKGTGTVYTRPTHAVFRLHETVAGDSVEAALKASQSFGIAVREFVVEKELRPTLVEISTPAIIALATHEVRTSIELHFSMTPFASGEAGTAKFGELCDQILAFALKRGCELAKPDFITSEQASVIQDAVEEATKNALVAAVGAAAAMNTAIRSVDAVEIGELTWNAPVDSGASYPTVDQISCTAEARVTYLVE